MNIKEINKKELKMLLKDTNSIIMEEQKDDYMPLYNLYRQAFTEYIIKTLNLRNYDNEIKNSGLKFKQVPSEDMDIYQYLSSDELEYIYVRNNIYLEKLNKEEMDFLRNRIEQNHKTLDAEFEHFIKQTYERVFFKEIRDDGEKYWTFFGPDSNSFVARNDSLVIGVRYDEFDANGLEDQEWEKLHIKQLDYLQDMFYHIAVEQKDNVSVPITVLKYNQFSTRIRITENREKEIKEDKKEL